MNVLEFVFFFKQKTAYEMRISDWSSDVCSSDLPRRPRSAALLPAARGELRPGRQLFGRGDCAHRQRRSRQQLRQSRAAQLVDDLQELGRQTVSRERKSVVQGRGVSVRVE